MNTSSSTSFSVRKAGRGSVRNTSLPFNTKLLALLGSLAWLGACGPTSDTPAGTGGSSTGGAGTGGAGTGGAGTGGAGTGGASTGGAGTGGAGTGGAGTGGAGTGGAGGRGTGGASTGGAGGAATGGANAGGTSGAGGRGGGAGGRGGSSGGAGGAGGSGGAGGAGTFTVTTPAFMNQAGCAANAAASCATFPRENTNYGMAPNQNVSPAMTWTGAPAGTQSFAVILQDLTNTNSHWVLWNIPSTVTMLPANISKTAAMPPMPAGSQQASRASNQIGYFGPGACGNVYEFVVYALSVPMFSPTMATNHTMVRTQLQGLNTILGTASMRARSFMPNCP